MTEQTTFEQVKAFTVKFRSEKPHKVTLNTTLEKNLGITGDDGDDFVLAFFNEFGIDYTDFEPNKYFAPEGFDPIGLSLLVRKILNLSPFNCSYSRYNNR